jgi:hypothetical protein
VNKKLTFIFLLLFNISVGKLVLADDNIERVLNERSRAYASNSIAGDILTGINSPSMDEIRSNYINPSTAATEQIPRIWISVTQDYMERVNNRASFDMSNNPAENIGMKKPDVAKFQAGIEELDKNLKHKLAKLDVSLIKKRNEIIKWTAIEKERATKHFKEASDAYEKKPTDVRSAPQTKLDQEFFNRKNLNQIETLEQVTPEEALFLRMHSKKPLGTSDPTEALEIINTERQKRKKFLEGIRDMSNNISDDVINQRASSYTGKNKEAIDQKYRDASESKHAQKYKVAVNARIGSGNSDLKALDVASKESRLALLDIITDSSIDPLKNDNSKIKNKLFNNFAKVDIGDALNSLPKGDPKAIEAFVRYTLEYGSAKQLQSLKIHATPTLIKMNKMNEANVGCRR